MPPNTLTTERLLLRGWLEADRQPFHALNADPRVMEFYPATLTAEQTDAMIIRIQNHIERHAFGLYAVELRESGAFIGYVGLNTPSFDEHFMPAVEIGWRIAFDFWGRGLATEGARAVVQYAFQTLKLPGLVSFAVPANQRSRRVMDKLGMIHDPAGDFGHPELPVGHSLRRHVLYRLNASDLWSLISDH
jgi:RimJ/RimL family protein N-acetyltransferase